MSRSVDLFLDSDQPLDRFASHLAQVTGRPFVPSPEGARCCVRDRGVTAYLSEHDFLDEEDLPLSQFRYVLSAPASGTGDLDATPEAAWLREVNSAFRQAGGSASLLVLDLERPSARQVAP